MDKKTYEDFVIKAGFCTWADEPWRPENAFVDWSQGYSKELKKFAKLVNDYAYERGYKDASAETAVLAQIIERIDEERSS